VWAIRLLIIPLFAFASTGVTLAGYSAAALAEPVALGALLGLLLGKPVGVFGAVWLAARLKLAPLPAQASLPMIYGVALLCGIGFTVSLFIATLSFSGTALLESAKLGIFAGSVLSALSGWLWLRMLPKPPG
jgi:NhaA family Na+:H+ antiporter